MVNRVIVLGGGSSGFLAAIGLKSKLPGLQVDLIRSKEIGIIGVGEGTQISVPFFLHGYLGLDAGEFHRVAEPTYKLGIRFVWGPRPYFNYTFSYQFMLHYKALPKVAGFYCEEDAEYANVNSALMTHDKAFIRLPNGAPGIRNDVAYHIENLLLVRYLEQKAAQLGVNVIDDTILAVEQDEHGISALRRSAGVEERADLYVDCSGFYSVLLGKALGEPFISFKSTLFCDRAVVGGWERGADEPIKPYTTCETMNSGWCWQIEHEHRINRGYVYSGAFISDDEAEKEFREKNPKLQPTRIVKFVSGQYARAWVKNVVAIGNSAGFVEPLESTSLAAICDEVQSLAGSLVDSDRQPGRTIAAAFNKRNTEVWESIRQFLAIHYRFNTRLDTPFWVACREKTDLAGAQAFVDYYIENGPSANWRDTLIGSRDVFGFEGYLTLMLGQRVPTTRTYTPSAAERQTWQAIRQANREQGVSGLSMEETLRVIRSPNWRYNPEFYLRQ